MNISDFQKKYNQINPQQAENYNQNNSYNNSYDNSYSNSYTDTRTDTHHVEPSEDEIHLQKLDMLRKLGELAQIGVNLSQNYNMNSDLIHLTK